MCLPLKLYEIYDIEGQLRSVGGVTGSVFRRSNCSGGPRPEPGGRRRSPRKGDSTKTMVLVREGGRLS